MTWAKFTDQFHQSDRILELDHQEFRLYTTGVTLACSLLKEKKTAPGVLSLRQAEALARQQGVRAAAVRGLIEKGRWEEVEGGIHIHDFDDYLPSRRDQAAERGEPDPAKAAAGRIGGSVAAANRQHTGSKAVADQDEGGDTHAADR